MTTTIVMGFDKTYAPAAVVALFSLFANTTRRDFEVCLFGDNLDAEALAPLQVIAEIFNRKIRIIDMKADRFEGFRLSGHISRAAYSRLIALMEIQSDRMIWLDCDIIVHEDIGLLLDTEIPSDYVVSGVRDLPVEAERKSALQLSDKDVYINNGVMLLDAKIWKSENLTNIAFELGTTDRQRFLYWDQCLINKLLEGRKALLPVKWNQMFHVFLAGQMVGTFPTASNFRGIVHYTTETKPWHIWSDRQFARLYKAYARVAPTRMPVKYHPERPIDRENFEKRLRISDY